MKFSVCNFLYNFVKLSRSLYLFVNFIFFSELNMTIENEKEINKINKNGLETNKQINTLRTSCIYSIENTNNIFVPAGYEISNPNLSCLHLKSIYKHYKLDVEFLNNLKKYFKNFLKTYETNLIIKAKKLLEKITTINSDIIDILNGFAASSLALKKRMFKPAILQLNIDSDSLMKLLSNLKEICPSFEEKDEIIDVLDVLKIKYIAIQENNNCYCPIKKFIKNKIIKKILKKIKSIKIMTVEINFDEFVV